METKEITIGNYKYLAYLAITDSEKENGLQGVSELETIGNEEEGMLFVYDSPRHLDFWMKDCDLTLSIIFIDEFGVVISNKKGVPNSEDFISEDDAQFVFECNYNSNIQSGDKTDLFKELDSTSEESIEEPIEEEFEEDEYPDIPINALHVYGPDGDIQAYLQGGERIFSRTNTRTLVNMAKRAYMSKLDSDYKRLGKKIFEYMHQQDSREPEWVEN